ncbi:MAG: hypothetical protein K0U38_08415, partial [Epsilonproteobacteria bacterium]|nr:hypothetical protein [Campylobacterota bacterium]
FDTTDFSITEGDSGQKNLNFTFTLDAPALAGTSFEYYTQDDEATVANSDYEAISTTTYTVPEGATTITIPVKINGDTDIENDETFYLKIQNEVKLTVHGHTAKGHILNDDGSFPALSFDSNSISMTEGDSGYKDFNFTLTLDADALAGSSFKYYTQDGTAQSSDSDYEAIPHTTYNIPEGERQITIPVKVNGDTAIESDETFYFKIFDEQNITIASSVMSATATILNDDGELPEFSIEAPIVAGNEGDSGTQNVHFSIKLDAPATQDGVSIDYQTLDGTATTSDNDYNSITPTTVTFNTGESEKSFFVTINGDVKIENDETFDIQLLNPQSANIAKHKESITITINNDDEHSDDPLVCDSTMYLSSSINREDDKAKGKMWLHTIDTTKNPFNFLVMNDDGSDKFYNALAYSDIDNYIYGLYKKELIRLSKTGKVISLGKVDGLPDILSTKQLFAGAIFGEHYYISGPGQDYDKIFKIKLSDKSVSEITLNTAISLLDFSFTPDGAYLHGIVDGGRLVKVDVATGVVTFIGSAHSGYQFDSSFSDKNGRFFANDSGGNGFFEFNLDTGEKLFLSASGNAEFNDGANCLKAALLFTDYSDAPESYGTPRHYIANGVFLGDEVDHDINAYTSTDALGDDSNGIDDEDGVTLTDGTDLNGSYFTPDTTQELNVKVAKAGYLNAWIDFNIDGVFNAGEQIITSQNFAAGTHTINFNIPNTVTLNTTTYIRFRFSSTPLLTATQDANDGEVEDYAVQFGSAVQPLRGTFNVERTNSNNNVINSDERNAWYTQIVGRDFDYSLVFYEEDMSAEKEIDNVTVKLELVNMESNKTLYSIERHILNTPPKSRIDITLPVDDLSRLPATKDARFRVTYGVDDAGVITQADCLSNPALCTNHRTDYARDNFAIRPESYYIVLADGNTTRRVNRDPINTTTPLRVAAGYDYNLSVIATQYRADNSIHASDDYNTSIKRVLIFQDKTNLNCADRDDNETTETFANGENSTNLLELPNAGAYKLHLKDSDWTAVDINKTIPDCTVNNADTSVNGNTLSGCNIVSNPDMNLNSYPYQFKVDFRPQSLPINGHDDFIYMSQLSSSNNNVAMQFDGNITAQSEDNTSTTNFTDGCVAYNVLLAPNATTLSEDGIDVLLQTSHHPSRSRTPVFFTRLIEYNDDNTTLESNNSLRSIDVPITIKSGRFLNENNGTTTLDIRYNINKHLSETINPVQVTFHSLDADSSDAHSEAEQSSMFIPKGHQDLDTMVRNFYFTQVAPDQINYPRVVFNSSPLIRTPLNIDIFCDKNSSYCIDTNVTTHSDVSSSPRLQEGWYLSVDHNESVDGHVTKLTPMPGIVTITPNPSSAFPIRFKSGRNGLITTKFNNCTETLHQSTITITPTTALLYNPTPLKAGEPTYTVTCTPNTPSQWTGVGDTGNIIESKPNVNSSSKIDW